MDHSCPGCGVSLERRYVPSKNLPEGVPFYRARASILVCPSCGIPLRRNDNSREATFTMLQIIAMTLFAAAQAFDRVGLWTSLALAAFVAIGGLRVWYVRHYLKHWKYWVADDPPR